MKRTIFTSTVMAILVLFAGCKTSDKTTQVTSLRDMIVKSLDNAQSVRKSAQIKATIKGIKENLDFDNAWDCVANGETMTVIPIGSGYEFVNNKGKSPKNYLVVFERDGKITNSFVWQALEGATVTKNSFANIYEHKKEELNGAYALLWVYDIFLVGMEYKNGTLIKTTVTNYKPAANSGKGANCTDWSLITTTHGADEQVLNTKETLVTTVCDNTRPMTFEPGEPISYIYDK